MTRFLLCVAVLWVAAAPAFAQAPLTRLFDVLGMDAYVDIIRSEGLEDADGLSIDMLGRPASGAFLQQIDAVYDQRRIREATYASMQSVLSDNEIAAALIFFDSDVGQRIVRLEVAARQAISDEEIEQTARQAWFAAQEDKPWIVARINEIKVETDLIERNVSGALNSNLRFYQGLADGGGLDLSEPDMLAQVWGQADEIRADTTAWLGAYLLMAYQPLSESDIADYIAFWRTETGQALNNAMFVAFDRLYDDISYATGRVVSLNMSAQDL